jgi:omega-6 fatty acid desaturase (delta-12 desaturase)
VQIREHRAIAKQLNAAGLFAPSDAYGYATLALELSLFGAGLFVLLYVRPWSFAFWVAQLHLGLSMFRFFVIVHECGHRTLFRSPRLCAVVGTIASAFCLVPFVPWSRVHRQHHKWVGIMDKDPTQELLLRMRSYSASTNFLYRIVWQLWIPVMYFVFIVRVFWGHPFATWRAGQRRDAIESLISSMLCLAPRVAVAFWLGWQTSLLWTLPMLAVFLFVDENLSLPQHTGLFPFVSSERSSPIPFHAQDAITRTTHEPGILAVLLSYNFTLHTEHHLFPGVPWYWLPKVHEKIHAVAHYQHVRFWQYMLRIRQQDPRDVYARALPPHAQPTREMQLVHADADRDGYSAADQIVGVVHS